MGLSFRRLIRAIHSIQLSSIYGPAHAALFQGCSLPRKLNPVSRKAVETGSVFIVELMGTHKTEGEITQELNP